MSESDERRDLPASEQGTGLIPEDRQQADDTGVAASESEELPDEGREPQSWPGTSAGSILPPG